MLQFTKAQPNTIQVKYNFDEEFRTIQVSVSGCRKSSKSLKRDKKGLYTDSLPVSEDKKKDLISLCDMGVIPKCYHPYDHQLKATSKNNESEE